MSPVERNTLPFVTSINDLNDVDETKELSAAFNAADATANVIENAELEAIATDSQDAHRGNDLKSDENIDQSQSELANIPGFSGLS